MKVAADYGLWRSGGASVGFMLARADRHIHAEDLLAFAVGGWRRACYWYRDLLRAALDFEAEIFGADSWRVPAIDCADVVMARETNAIAEIR
jgi:hypothetical protein